MDEVFPQKAPTGRLQVAQGASRSAAKTRLGGPAAGRKREFELPSPTGDSIFSTEGKSGTELRRVAKTHANRHYPPPGGGGKRRGLPPSTWEERSQPAEPRSAKSDAAAHPPSPLAEEGQGEEPRHRVSSGRIQAEAAKTGGIPPACCSGRPRFMETAETACPY